MAEIVFIILGVVIYDKINAKLTDIQYKAYIEEMKKRAVYYDRNKFK